LVELTTVGVLALQGGFSNHLDALATLGVSGREVRVPADLAGLDGLILPGGESTTMTLGIEREGLGGPLSEFVRSGKPVLATCAGTILLDDAHLALLDFSTERNAYGPQVHSFEGDVSLSGDRTFPGVFIRAPRIVRVGEDVEVVAIRAGEPVGVKSGAVTAYTFHPELTSDVSIHKDFLQQEGG
jgi:5'-phosphate synthase pdxT subunit